MSFDYDARAIGAISPAGVREHADNLVRLLRNEREDLVSPSSPHLTESVLRVSLRCRREEVTSGVLTSPFHVLRRTETVLLFLWSTVSEASSSNRQDRFQVFPTKHQ